MKYKGDKPIIKTKKFRLKTSTRLTKYFDSMYSESHMWINAGCQAKKHGLSVFDCKKIGTIVQTIPQVFAHGAITAGMQMECSHIEYGKHVYPLFSSVALGKKSTGDTVYFPKCKIPFYLQKGTLPDDMQSYKIVDVTNRADKERQFELHITIRSHIPPRKMTGVSAGVDLGGVHTAVAVTSDGDVMVLTLREKDTMRVIAKLQKQISRCKKNSCRYRRLYDKLKSIYKKLGNRQLDKMRKFNNKLMRMCDTIIIDGMNLQKMTAKGPGKRGLDRVMRQGKAGEMRKDLADRSPGNNVIYQEVNPANTTKQCYLCGSMITWRKSRKWRCVYCWQMMHADINGGGNMLYNTRHVAWSKRMQNIDKMYDKAGLVLRDKLDLRRRTIPPSVGDWAAGTGDSQKRLVDESLNGLCKDQQKKCMMVGDG